MDKCIICGADARLASTFDQGRNEITGYAYDCKHCGYYTVSSLLIAEVEGFKAKAPALVTEMRLKGITTFSLTQENGHGRILCDGHDFLETFPDELDELIDRVLVNLSRCNLPSVPLQLDKQLERLFFASDLNQLKTIVKILSEIKYINIINDHPDIYPTVSLSYEGWKYAKGLQRKEDSRTTAFIAMWFHERTKEFREATKEAISQAGYVPIIIDEHQHNDFIMDKIINFINEARFVIADFTCIPEEQSDSGRPKCGVRGGVYYEAGYAKGLKREVIHTCHVDSQPRMHFDIQQKNTIFWKEEADGEITTNGQNYIEYLKEHIWATIGKRS